MAKTWETSRLGLGLVFVPIALLASGCGPQGATRYIVSGQVTYDGQPLPAGVILFEPDTKRGNMGLGGFAAIHDGKYRTLPNRGVSGGPYVVKINGGDGQGIQLMKPYGDVIPKSGEHRMDVELPHENAERNFNIPRSAHE